MNPCPHVPNSCNPLPTPSPTGFMCFRKFGYSPSPMTMAFLAARRKRFEQGFVSRSEAKRHSYHITAVVAGRVK